MVCSLSLDLFIFCFPSWCFLDETCIFRTLFFIDRIFLQAFPSLTIKFSSGNCRARSCNGTLTVSLFPRRLCLPEVDCSDQSLAIDGGTGLSCKFVADAIFAQKEKELPSDQSYFFSVGVSTSCNGNRQSTHTSNTTQVHK